MDSRECWIPKRSIFDSVLFLIYIRVLSTGLSLTLRLLADDTFLFSVVRNRNTSVNESTNEYLT